MCRRLVLLASLLFSVFHPSPGHGETVPMIPPQYGKVIYSSDPRNANHIFIIGISHRDTLTRANDQLTPKVQAEVYKIAEWLIQQRELELLLPEGFFQAPPGGAPAREKSPPYLVKEKSPQALDMQVLEELLSDRKKYINAEMLLRRKYPLRMQQVEDQNLYFAVHRAVSKLAACSDNSYEFPIAASELNYLEERRTAAMLQKIPGIIDQEYREGHIRSRRAIFTIGMYHIHKILKYLEERRITVFSPLLTPAVGADYVVPLNLMRENFGACVILPRTLAENEEALKMNKLDKMITRQGSFSSPFLFTP